MRIYKLYIWNGEQNRKQNIQTQYTNKTKVRKAKPNQLCANTPTLGGFHATLKAFAPGSSVTRRVRCISTSQKLKAFHTTPHRQQRTDTLRDMAQLVLATHGVRPHRFVAADALHLALLSVGDVVDVARLLHRFALVRIDCECDRRRFALTS